MTGNFICCAQLETFRIFKVVCHFPQRILFNNISMSSVAVNRKSQLNQIQIRSEQSGRKLRKQSHL